MPQSNIDWTVAELAEQSQSTPFDCVIVGGGSAGLTTARTLAESGKQVAVLEAGPAPFLTHIVNTELRFSRDLTRSVRGQVQYSPTLPDGEAFGNNYGCLGGRGLFWNGASPRYREYDFDGWPFGVKELEPHYLWAEREFRVTRQLGETTLAKRIIDSLATSGFPAQACPFAIDVDALGRGSLSAGVASGLGAFFRAAGSAVASGQIKIATSSLAERIHHADGAARGVIASPTGQDRSAEIFARSVVLAGGGVETIRLASNSELPDASGRLGLGIQDHIFYRCYFEGPHVYDPAQPDVAIVYIPAGSQQTGQWEIHAPGPRLFTVDDGQGWSPATGGPYRLMIRSFAATEKRDENRVEAREGGLGSATVHFSYTDKDEAQKETLKQHALEIGKALKLELAEDRLSGPGGSYNEAGGLDMGTDPSNSVTDAG